MIEKSPFSSLMARCLRFLSPMHITEPSEVCELLFDKVFIKLMSNKKFFADSTKRQYSKFWKTVAYNNNEEFSSFSKEHENLDLFS